MLKPVLFYALKKKGAKNVMAENLNVFINTGLDMDLAKSYAGKAGLVQVRTNVQGKHGSYQRMQWVRPEDASKQLNETYSSARDENGKPVKPVFFPVADSGNTTTRTFTAEEVVDYHKKSGSHDTLQDFVKKNYFISDGRTQTRDFYHKGGQYSEKRQKLHNQIIDRLLSEAGTPKAGEKPVCILLGGGTASGKSTIRDAYVEPDLKESNIKVATVDSDEIKNEIPEYEHFKQQDAESAAFRVHQESADIANAAIDALVSSKKHFIYDGTMKSLSKYDTLIDKLKEAGYTVRMVVADVPLGVAMKRAQSRAEKTGRKVPKSIIEGSHGGCALTYPQIASKADEFELYDNSGDTPILVQDNQGVHNKELYDAFVKKGEEYQKKRKAREHHGS